MGNIKRMQLAAFLLILVIILNGCSMKSEDEALNDAQEAAQLAFDSKESVAPNHDLDSFSLYIPDNLEVKKESKSNVILEDGDQLYIVFDNQLEDPKSKLSYQATKKEEALLNKSFEDDAKFGYIHILPDNGEGYEMKVGIGGVKITTFTTKGKMADDAKDLMKIARSIAIPETPEKS